MMSEKNLSLYNKLHKIQSLVKFKTNNLDKEQIFGLLKSFLKKYQVGVFFSDILSPKNNGENSFDSYSFKKDENQWVIKFWKQVEFVNIQDQVDIEDKTIVDSFGHQINYEINNEKQVYTFLAIGSGIDLSKAKSAADSCAIKSFLINFFLFPN